MAWDVLTSGIYTGRTLKKNIYPRCIAPLFQKLFVVLLFLVRDSVFLFHFSLTNKADAPPERILSAISSIFRNRWLIPDLLI